MSKDSHGFSIVLLHAYVRELIFQHRAITWCMKGRNKALIFGVDTPVLTGSRAGYVDVIVFLMVEMCFSLSREEFVWRLKTNINEREGRMFKCRRGGSNLEHHLEYESETT